MNQFALKAGIKYRIRLKASPGFYFSKCIFGYVGFNSKYPSKNGLFGLYSRVVLLLSVYGMHFTLPTHLMTKIPNHW